MTGDGRIIWITGLSGVGKTTLANALQRSLSNTQSVRVLDGDQLRRDFGIEGYDRVSRLEVGERTSQLAQQLCELSQVVLVATISMFHLLQQHNRASCSNYQEILLTASWESLITRRPNLYGPFATERDVVGVDLDAEEPKNPELKLNTSVLSVSQCVDQVHDVLF